MRWREEGGEERLVPLPALTTLQRLLASGEDPARQHASGRQAFERQHILTLLSAGNTRGNVTEAPSKQHTHTHMWELQSLYLRTENILAIFPIARILFLITSLRAAAALAAEEHTRQPVSVAFRVL